MSTHSERMKPNTMATEVYKRLKNDIINGVYPAGSHLVRRTLAKKYGVSMLPILEACLRLEADGLVENSPLLGAYVVEVTPARAADELILREAIECQAARQYALNASERDRRLLQEHAEFLDSVQEKLDPGNREVERLFQKQHSDFHVEISRASGARVLYEQMKKVWYRRLMLICNVNTALFPNPRGWHAQLASALNRGDPDAAEREMRSHVQFNREKNQESVREIIRRGRAELYDSIMDKSDGSGQGGNASAGG